jgi:hypothetical protein
VLDGREPGVRALDLRHDPRARQAGLGGLADRAAGVGIDALIERDLEGGELGDVAVGDGVHRLAVDPGQQREAPLGRHRHHLGVRPMPLRSMKRSALTSASSRLRLSAAGYFFSA